MDAIFVWVWETLSYFSYAIESNEWDDVGGWKRWHECMSTHSVESNINKIQPIQFYLMLIF